MDQPRDTLFIDIGIGLLAGLVATKVTGLAQEALARPMPEGVKEYERRLRPEPTSRVAARRRPGADRLVTPAVLRPGAPAGARARSR